MLKILLVDDEEIICQGLEKIINRFHKFAIVGHAHNGLKALELVETLKPDIVISDIKMPQMDGLALLRELQINYPSIKKALLSGYDEFSYVREALISGACDYLLKPVDIKKLETLLNQFEDKIFLERKNTESKIRQNIKFHQSLPLLKDQFINNVLESYKVNDLEFVKGLQEYDLIMYPENIQVLIISIDNYKDILSHSEPKEASLKAFTLRNITEETLQNHKINFLSCENKYGLVIILSFQDGIPTIKKTITQLANNLLTYSNLQFTIAIGPLVHEISQIHNSYHKAILALDTRFYKIGSSLIYYPVNNNASTTDDILEIKSALIKSIRNAIDIGEFNSIIFLVKNFFSKAYDLKLSKLTIINTIYSLFTILENEHPKFKYTLVNLYGSDYNFLNKLELFDTFIELRNFVNSFFEEVIESIGESIYGRGKKLVLIAKEYIRNNFQNDLKLDQVASILYVNPNYFCTIFKNETGETFNDYLTKVRINHAKQLLKNINIKAYEVASMVGYNDSTYFSKVFKKIVGQTPSEYRNK